MQIGRLPPGNMSYTTQIFPEKYIDNHVGIGDLSDVWKYLELMWHHFCSGKKG